MEIQEQSKLKFNGVDIINVQFKATRPSIGVEKDVEIACTPKVFYPKDNAKKFNVIMELKLSSEGYFELFVGAIGEFELNQDITEELKKTFVNMNAPAIMFPYLRAFVTTLSANMGTSVGTLIMPTQFFNGKLEEVTDDNE